MDSKNQTTKPIIDEILALKETAGMKDADLIANIVDWQRWNRLKRGQSELNWWEAVELYKVFGYQVKVYKPEEVAKGGQK